MGASLGIAVLESHFLSFREAKPEFKVHVGVGRSGRPGERCNIMTDSKIKLGSLTLVGQLDIGCMIFYLSFKLR